MADPAATRTRIEERIEAMRQGWFAHRNINDRLLLIRASSVISDMLLRLAAAEHDLTQEQARSAALERELAQAWEAAGFERNGFDKLGSVHDSLGTVKDLLKALDLVGDGIGGEVGFAVSAVANEAAMSAENAFAETGSMIEMRKKVLTP